MTHVIDHTIKTRLLLRPIRSHLGTIRLAGVNQGGVGVGMAPEPLRTLSCYTFNLILNGHGFYREADDRLTPLQRGDIAFSFAHVPHGYGTVGDAHWDELWFEFEGPVFDLMRQTGLLDPAQPIHRTGDSDAWFRRLFRIIPPSHLRQRTPPQVIVSRFVSVLTEILADQETPEEPDNPTDDWVNRACEMLGHLDESPVPTPADVARKLGMSYETFRKRFRAKVGFSPGQFQLDARIDRAAALLHQGRLQIKEIAAHLEFCDEFHFSRSFKRRFGTSPREFRRRILGR
ncbi:helix-turn-helix domain-containing protein [Synoicihabitans lomoniglobus]|uniref:AraC family transcriptional regulator n=1 Tax=Synoicihabitans lomoniglobus TaxID=2909285 RepID=A0AAF0CNB0_9BACT|nr:AraC family transcriptional regulator [Opitutaceae bacterium LMO-M01]WED64205.1 AraC family transcriptional regulator [Opitutaceae bacterium LMO-M01]